MSLPEADIRTGRREEDGLLRVSIFMDDMVALTLEGSGERTPAILLSLEQARRLEEALTRLLPLIEKATREAEKDKGTVWDGAERRKRLAS